MLLAAQRCGQENVKRKKGFASVLCKFLKQVAPDSLSGATLIPANGYIRLQLLGNRFIFRTVGQVLACNVLEVKYAMWFLFTYNSKNKISYSFCSKNTFIF
jgi:hypothetical protein